MPKFLIEVPHEADTLECTRVVHVFLSTGSHFLTNAEWGCKSGVHKASFYDPELNRSYGKLAAHYDVGVLPTRSRKPRDKSKVEVGVRFAQFYILGRLRNRTFFSLAEANAAIAQAVERMNDAPLRRLGISRRDLFETVERPLAALPAEDYEFAQWQFARVGLDYHIEVDGFFYSVPFGLIGEQVDVRLTQRTLEAFHKGERVAAHSRRYGGQGMAPSPSTCRPRIGITPPGRRSASAPGPLRSAPTPRC